MKDGSAHARKRMIDDLVEVRQKCDTVGCSCSIVAVSTADTSHAHVCSACDCPHSS